MVTRLRQPPVAAAIDPTGHLGRGPMVSRVLRRAAAACISTALGLLLLEGALRLWYRMPISERYYTERPSVVAYGLAPSLRWQYRYSGRPITVITDADGHRLTPGASPRAERTLYLIGDSQLFGWGLSNDQTIAARLQLRLGTGWRVVNLGVPGYGPYAYAHEISQLPPASMAIVLQTEANDFQDAYFARSPFQSRCGYLLSRSSLAEEMPCAVLSSYVFVTAVDVVIKQFGRLSPALGYNPIAVTAARVLRYRIENLYRAALQDRGDRVLFGAIPWDAAIVPARLSNYEPSLASSRRIVELPDESGLDAIFLRRADRDLLFQVNDSHLSALGADVVAERLAVLAPLIAGDTRDQHRGTIPGRVWPASLE